MQKTKLSDCVALYKTTTKSILKRIENKQLKPDEIEMAVSGIRVILEMSCNCLNDENTLCHSTIAPKNKLVAFKSNQHKHAIISQFDIELSKDFIQKAYSSVHGKRT
ncbi:MAG: hypothetical protein A2W90_02420 [Bacteroidetes bacterium GWF2_42_66]|nr:MAG: hypothetical protein A2W92_08495 [Bacteroidetes bacterium GWA2_42_15]OFY01205.1 MAG: hypothetical protein A2W89_15905 [Bacteroidetes bacterium GWE2_42_39]OFY42048.1 MAG: hypothetical protein A2W90_02420 [Bacteroidetes bacterium GWF2_42_66]HBL77749.1 hypothetical protein [Prolixibacteraceae bacterium]HCB62878.1 hypothetical protein [Bacteroidales bacterium]